MTITGFILVGRNGSVEWRARRPGVTAAQIAFQVDLDVHDDHFERPLPVIHITVPKPEPIDKDMIVEITAKTVSRTLGVNIDTVRDGLHEAIAEVENGE